ncbi:hypothetical protein B0I35DRAFT_481297 [Stachybotrys elegans]|uniref:Mid2 domain-containing protein n=1 Tax=Stachybotrys elegans TaxID=80388 RepID=A0A8K0WMP8_9HYPO|nr:hypothetical protein B0I35DRAFT_481297 [Stachybotrys elegans]
MSDLGSLTTTFTRPTDACSDSTDIYRIVTREGSGHFVQGPIELESCFPENYNPNRSAYYSPGVCPDGYTIACSRTSSSGSATETYHTCCPIINNFQCIVEDERRHQSTLICSIALSLGVGVATWTIGPVTEIDEVSDETRTIATVRGTGGALNAYGIQYRFQAETTTATSSSSVTSESSTVSISLQPTESTATSTPDPEPASASDNSLSSGATAGIAVGTVVGVLAIVGIAIFFWIKRKRERKVDHSSTPELPGISGAHTSRLAFSGRLSKRQYGNLAEMPSDPPPAEMDGTSTMSPAVEMDSNPRRF